MAVLVGLGRLLDDGRFGGFALKPSVLHKVGPCRVLLVLSAPLDNSKPLSRGLPQLPT